MLEAHNERKHNTIKVADRNAAFWKDLALRIHAHPEIGLEEEKASAWLTEALEGFGFATERGVADLPTSFIASWGDPKANPVIAFLAEYDALPSLGHACSHNLICTAACLAAVSLAKVIGPGAARIQVIGTPAEENYGGKVQMVEHGVFKDIDIALMAHGYHMNVPSLPASGRKSVVLEFFGKSAHAGAAPHLGINALDAMVQTFNGIAMLRQHLPEKDQIHGIITHGGQAANIIPEYTRAEFYVRSFDVDRLETLAHRVVDCANGAALATGCRLATSAIGLTFLPIRHNSILNGLYTDNMRFQGEEVSAAARDSGAGSTDFGNVSQVVPGAHGYFKVTETAQVHTPDFATACESELGLCGMVVAAKAMALTALDVIDDADLRRRIVQEFHSAK